MTEGHNLTMPAALDNLDSLPHWPSNEPPDDSMCAVGYTVSEYRGHGQAYPLFNFNILWLGVVFGKKYVFLLD